MCLIFVSIHNHPRYKLIIAANRDEFYQRRTSPAEFWNDSPHLLGGRDLEAGGTWLGMTTSGKVSLLTNFRDPATINPSAPSRGQLVVDFLQGSVSGDQFLTQVEKGGKKYNGFNLLAGTADELWYYSNYAQGVQKLGPGLHGLSNHLMDTPWPKVERGKQLIRPLLERSSIKPEELFEFMYDEQRAPDDHLPDTGVGLERERALSSMFIKSPGYGSRCSTVVFVDKQNKVVFSERTYDLTTFQHTTKTFDFAIPL